MLSSEGKPTDNAAIGKQVPSTTQIQWEQELDREQVFQLIENILSFEACFYHQLLPLRKEDNNLLLGMVNSQDSAALDYVNRIISYMNCTMMTQPISGETHRKILSAYLNYKNTSLPTVKPVHKSSTDLTQQKKAETLDNQTMTSANATSRWELTQVQTSENAIPQAHSPHISTPLTPSIIPPETEDLKGDKETHETSPTEHPNSLHILHLPDIKAFTAIEELAVLPPKKLLEQLLGRVLSAGGIGRLYLERQPYQGRILWSDNGVLQSVLEKLPLSVFQGILNELKRFASLSVTTIVEPKQVEKECLYQQNRLLLRLRVMPGMHGEEATLQVLRGAALKFYQQQQLARLSRDTLGVSHQLSYKLHELKKRLVLTHKLNSGQLEVFNALNQLLENLDYQVRILTEISEPPKSNK
ncbi:hypothetical protein [Mastigocladopsis repens]|uniref:hypothetical protein n=1 Tax=Mastigocladopsis repens TaxID=221287 RepID=UPI0002DAD33A|nr:hypothetical protein [Mastigocladopsis repens]